MKIESTDDLAVAMAASKFAALGSEQRLGVLKALVRAGPEGLSIGELGERCAVTGSTLTHHLRILTQAGLVQHARQGRSTICAAAAYDEVRLLSDFLLKHCCADRDDVCCSTEDHSHG